MERPPIVSIVTPSFNQGQYIEETILSILEQGYPCLEYIIIDGGSTDNTVEIIKKYQKYLAFWVSEPDNGQSHAINKGIKKCTGNIFNWVNSDDILEPGALFTVSEAFDNKNTDLVCGRSKRFCPDGRIESVVQTSLMEEVEKSIFFGGIRQLPTFYKLSIVRQLEAVDEKCHYVMDSELFIRYLLNFGQDKILFINEAIGKFRLHENSKTVSQEDKFAVEFRMVIEELIENYQPSVFSHISEAKLMAYFHLFKALKTSRKNNLGKYVSHIWRASKTYPKPFSNSFVEFLIKNILFYRNLGTKK